MIKSVKVLRASGILRVAFSKTDILPVPPGSDGPEGYQKITFSERTPYPSGSDGPEVYQRITFSDQTPYPPGSDGPEGYQRVTFF